MDQIPDLGARFGIAGDRTDVRPLGRGHIHATFLASYAEPGGSVRRVVHQRLNTSVFGDVGPLMANFVRITAHLAGRAADGRGAVRLVPAADGRPVAFDDDGAAWRTLGFIDGAVSNHRFDGPAQAAEAAAVVARFVANLADLTPAPAEVIPGFHDIPRRLRALEQAREDDVCRRAPECGPEADVIAGHAPLAAAVASARADGRLPQRTVHNDAKADNLLFDEATGRGLCLVDLDTVGPGTVLFDVGDLVRSGAVRGREDGDPSVVTVDHDVVEAILDGYARAGKAFLTVSEVASLTLAGPLMALEAAARFLTDHLQGDVYFRVDGPGHNLRRARNQIRLLELLLAG